MEGGNGEELGMSGESVGSREGALGVWAVGVDIWGVDLTVLGVDDIGVMKSVESLELRKRTCNRRLVTVRLRSSCMSQKSCGVTVGDIFSAFATRNKNRSEVETRARVSRSSWESLTVMVTEIDADGKRIPTAGRTM